LDKERNLRDEFVFIGEFELGRDFFEVFFVFLLWGCG
jgi:hypothetical protein